MNINCKILDYLFFKKYNQQEDFDIIDDYYLDLLDDKDKLFEKIIGKSEEESNLILNFNGDKNSFYNHLDLNDLISFRKDIFGIEKKIDKVNFFTISSKESFNNLLITPDIDDKVWNNSVLYFPLNDHSRIHLSKGDVLFCNRIGQFENLSEALNTRGIYGVGIALTDPIEFFPEEEGHNRYGVIVSFPLSLKNSLSTRNIQMNPVTIDLTPYNGNRNDALQWISEREKAIELLKMISFNNQNISNLFKIFYDFEIPRIDILPNDYLISKYSAYNIKSIKKTTEQKIFFGSPGTGKSYNVDNEIKNLDTKFYERVTFHPEFDHATFVGGYKPVSEKDEKGNDFIKYKFVPQAFTNIYERAWQDLDNQYYLVIEEINRGNCAEIFGDIFQLLDRNSNYTVSPSEELKNHLIEKFGNDKNHDGIVKGLKLPPNLTIYATMNTSDQSLFPMDSAFKRRWEWEYVPINYEALNENGESNDSFEYKVYLDDEKVKYFNWIDFIEKVNLLIEANENLGMDKCIGNYFIKSDTKEITLHEFINKVIFYLWNDVFKDEDVSKSIFEKGISFEKFFPIHKNAIPLIEKILVKIDAPIFPKAE